MTLALRLRKWGGGGGNCCSLSFTLRTGWRLVWRFQRPDRGRKKTRSCGRHKGAGRVPQSLPYLPSFSSRPFHSLSQEPLCGEKELPLLGCSGRKVGAGDRWGRSKARFPGPAAARQRCSLCSTRRTHFPRWLGSAVESVGISGEGGMRLPPSRGENHSTVKDALPPCPPVIVEEVYAALGKSRPLSHPPRTSPSNSGGKMLEEAEGVYSSLWSDKGWGSA